MAEREVDVPRSLQVWRGLMNWLSFFFRIFIQIVRGTPSLAQFLSYIGLRQSYLSSPSSDGSLRSHSFRPLPVVEIPLQDSFPDGHVVGYQGDDVTVDASDRASMDKLTVSVPNFVGDFVVVTFDRLLEMVSGVLFRGEILWFLFWAAEFAREFCLWLLNRYAMHSDNHGLVFWRTFLIELVSERITRNWFRT